MVTFNNLIADNIGRFAIPLNSRYICRVIISFITDIFLIFDFFLHFNKSSRNTFLYWMPCFVRASPYRGCIPFVVTTSWSNVLWCKWSWYYTCLYPNLPVISFQFCLHKSFRSMSYSCIIANNVVHFMQYIRQFLFKYIDITDFSRIKVSLKSRSWHLHLLIDGDKNRICGNISIFLSNFKLRKWCMTN